MMGGWFRVWMTGKGSSVGPGIIRISRVWGMAHLIGSALAGLMGSMSFRRRRLRPGLGEQALLAPDEIEVAKVDEETGALPQDEHGVAAVNRVDEQDGAATDGEEPEGDGNDALPPALGGDPLHEEAAEEEALPQESDGQPELLSRHDQRLTGFAAALATQSFRGPDEPPPTLPETKRRRKNFSNATPLPWVRKLPRRRAHRPRLSPCARIRAAAGHSCRRGTPPHRRPRSPRVPRSARRRDGDGAAPRSQASTACARPCVFRPRPP